MKQGLCLFAGLLISFNAFAVDWNVISHKDYHLKSTVELGRLYKAVGDITVNFSKNTDNTLQTRAQINSLRIIPNNNYLPEPTITLPADAEKQITDMNGIFENSLIKTPRELAFSWKNVLLKANEFDSGSPITLDFSFTFQGSINDQNELIQTVLPTLTIKITPESENLQAELLSLFTKSLQASQEGKSLIIRQTNVKTESIKK